MYTKLALSIVINFIEVSKQDVGNPFLSFCLLAVLPWVDTIAVLGCGFSGGNSTCLYRNIKGPDFKMVVRSSLPPAQAFLSSAAAAVAAGSSFPFLQKAVSL